MRISRITFFTLVIMYLHFSIYYPLRRNLLYILQKRQYSQNTFSIYSIPISASVTNASWWRYKQLTILSMKIQACVSTIKMFKQNKVETDVKYTSGLHSGLNRYEFCGIRLLGLEAARNEDRRAQSLRSWVSFRTFPTTVCAVFMFSAVKKGRKK